MPGITPDLLAIAQDARCNVFVESGTYYGESFRRAIESGVFERCYSVEIQPELYNALHRQFPEEPGQLVFLGKSYEVFVRDIFPLCSPEDRIFFWLDGHFSAGTTGGADLPCPLTDELLVIQQYCPTRSVVIAVDDADDFGRRDAQIPGRNWPTRAEIDDLAYRINPDFVCLDYTGTDGTAKWGRGLVIFSYRQLSLAVKFHAFRLRSWYFLLGFARRTKSYLRLLRSKLGGAVKADRLHGT